MRIWFVFFEDPVNPVSYPLGVGLLAALLKEHGHVVAGQHIHEDPAQPEVMEGIVRSAQDFQPDLLAYSCTSPAFKYIQMMATVLRQALPVPSICGGAHPTLYPEETLRSEGIDFICVGEGEKSFLDFVARLEKGQDCSHLPGIWTVGPDGQIIRNGVHPLVQDLDSLPWTDYEVFGKQFISNLTADGWLRFITSRGCPYSCSYCHTPMFRKVYAEGIGVTENKVGYIRFRGVDSMIREIQASVAKYDLKMINFMDDLFCLKKDRTLEFCKRFQTDLPDHVGYSIQTHLQHLDQEVVDALRKSRCRRVVVGVESAAARILELFNRQADYHKMKDRLNILVKARFPLGTWTLNILGNPTETVEEMLTTLGLNATTLVERIKFNYMAPYPKSDLYDFCQAQGIIVGNLEQQEFHDRWNTKLKFGEREEAFLEKFVDIGHWYVNRLAPLDLESFYGPLIEEIEKIGPGQWPRHREHYLARDRQLSEALRHRQRLHYEFVFKGKVYSNVIGLCDQAVAA